MKSTYLTEEPGRKKMQRAWGKFTGKNEEPFETKMDQIMALGGFPTKGSQVPLSGDCRYDFDQMDEDVAADVEGSEFWPWCEETIPKKRMYICFGKFLTPAEILSFGKTMTGSILKLPNELADLAQKKFQKNDIYDD